LFSFLAHLGWQVAPRAQARTLKTPVGELGWFALSLPDGATLLAISMGEELPSTAGAFRRFEDFTAVHRRILKTLRTHALHGRYVLLLSGFRAHLIDQLDDDFLLAVESRDEWDNRLLPLLDLQAVARGALSSFPRKSLHQRARELADWTHLWSARIGSRLEISPLVMARFFDWLHLSRLVLQHFPALHPSGTADGFPGSRKEMEELFRLLGDSYNLLQGAPLKTQLTLLDEAHRVGLLTECLESYALLSSAKLDAVTLGEAFADDALRLLSWRSSVVAGPTIDPDDEDDLFSFVQRTYEVDLDENGTAVLLRRFDDLVSAVSTAALTYERAMERGERMGVQLDLLAAPVARPRAEEATRHVLKYILRVRTAESRRADLVRLLLVCRATERAADAGHPLRPLPPVLVEVRGGPPARDEFSATGTGRVDGLLN
jgi:hypothetical protein